MWNFKNKCCVYRVENAAQATRLPLVLGVKHVQAPLGGPSACLTSFNEATRPTDRHARNNHAWHHYSQLKYLKRCVERVGNFRRVEGNVSQRGDPKNYVNKQKIFDKIKTHKVRVSKLKRFRKGKSGYENLICLKFCSAMITSRNITIILVPIIKVSKTNLTKTGSAVVRDGNEVKLV